MYQVLQTHPLHLLTSMLVTCDTTTSMLVTPPSQCSWHLLMLDLVLGSEDFADPLPADSYLNARDTSSCLALSWEARISTSHESSPAELLHSKVTRRDHSNSILLCDLLTYNTSNKLQIKAILSIIRFERNLRTMPDHCGLKQLLTLSWQTYDCSSSSRLRQANAPRTVCFHQRTPVSKGWKLTIL